MDLHLQLEMPLEALLLRHLAAAAAGSLWACLAVLAAAFGFWRIRSAAVASKPDDPHGVDHTQARTQQQPPSAKRQPEAPEKPRSEAGRWPRQLAVAGEQGPCVASPRKETLFEAHGCYELVVDDEDDDRRGGGAVEGEEDYCLQYEEYRDVLTHTLFANHTFVDPFRCGYISVLSQHREADKGMPAGAAAGVGAVAYGGGRGWGERWRGNPGWYLHQDMAALNGGVVRLWENEKLGAGGDEAGAAAAVGGGGVVGAPTGVESTSKLELSL